MLTVGRINKLFGVDGGVSATLYPAFPDNFRTTEPLFVDIDGLAVPLFCASFERRGQTGAILRFDDIDSPRRAEEMLGRELMIASAESEQDDDEFYMEDLIGFSAEIGGTKGELTDYIDSEANPLFEVTIGDRPYLIPAVEEFIAHIDFDARTIRFVLPEGLLDL